MRPGRISLLTLAIIGVIGAGCASEGSRELGQTQPEAESPNDTGAGSTPEVSATEAPVCEIPPGQAFQVGASIEVAEYGEVDGVTVSGAIYPHPDYEGNPWSQWGQGYVLEDGRFFSAIGDHHGADGNSFIYEYDPGTNALTQIADVLSYVDHVPGTWGYGKIHSQMVPGPCGEIYFSTYWGSFRGIEFEGNYRGDLIFRLDPYGRSLRPLDVPVEFHGQASLAASPRSGLIYGEAVDPVVKNDGVDRGPFFAYDVSTEETTFVGSDEPHVGYRSVIVDADGVAYYSIGGGELVRFDPASGDTSTHDARLPGDWVRAATKVGPDGSVYGVTFDPDRLFAMNPDGDFQDLGPALGYTASVALAPDGSAFYYLPGAHGNSANWGSPLISVDTQTGEQTTVVELLELVEDATGYIVGGTYNVAVSEDGSRVFLGVNVGRAGTDSTFGEVMLLIIDIP